jgi:hypothetical protein
MSVGPDTGDVDGTRAKQEVQGAGRTSGLRIRSRSAGGWEIRQIFNGARLLRSGAPVAVNFDVRRDEGHHLDRSSIMTYALWFVQALLALGFLFAGGVKLAMPIEELTAQMPLPGLFLRFIAVCEVLGAVGLILPGLQRIRPGLTPLAAAGLVIIMAGATVLTLAGLISGVDPVLAVIPLILGLLAAFVAYGRWRLAPLGGASRRVRLQRA